MPILPFEDPGYLESVYAALFTLLQTATFPNNSKFQTIERTADPPDEVAVASQPALRLFPGPMHSTQMDGASALPGVAKWVFSAGIAIYIRGDTSSTPNPLPTTLANNFVWGIARALATAPPAFPPYQKQTLGGLVYNCWIEGSVETEVVNEQITIAIPVLILPGPYGV